MQCIDTDRWHLAGPRHTCFGNFFQSPKGMRLTFAEVKPTDGLAQVLAGRLCKSLGASQGITRGIALLEHGLQIRLSILRIGVVAFEPSLPIGGVERSEKVDPR